QRFVELGELVDLAHRIRERRHVKNAVLGAALRLLFCRLRLREGSGAPFLTRTQTAIPEIDERLEARLDRREAEAVARVRNVRAVVLLDERLDARARLPGRLREPPREVHVVFG